MTATRDGFGVLAIPTGEWWEPNPSDDGH
jgi:hypothetical protein